jgi:hypothetical protein
MDGVPVAKNAFWPQAFFSDQETALFANGATVQRLPRNTSQLMPGICHCLIINKITATMFASLLIS